MREKLPWLHSPVTWLLIIAAYEALVFFGGLPLLEKLGLQAYANAFFFLPPVLVLAMLFFHFFTLELPKSNDAESERARELIRSDLIKYAFVFMFVAIGFAIVPFFLLSDVQLSRYQHPIALFVGCSMDAGAEAELACPTDSEKKGRRQWVLNIGGYTRQCAGTDAGSQLCIEGGLVVPVYFLILGLFGGAVSLLRRVPEYQKRSTPGYVGSEKEPPINIAELREYLVFQIIQFVSAPFLAVVAYNFIDPSKQFYAVPLGFASGFASETILLMIRAVIEKINPSGAPRPRTGHLSGMVLDSQSKRGIGNARITLLATDDAVTADENGHYILPDVPVGTQTIQVDNSGHSTLVKCEVRGGKVESCNIELP